MKARPLWVKYEYGKNVAPIMKAQASGIPGLVKKDNPCLHKASSPVDFPLSDNTKYALYSLVKGLDRNHCPNVLDMMSAPMIGHNIKAVGLQLS